MDDSELPALYRAADAMSKEAQAQLLSSFRLNAILLVAAALVALFSGTRALAILSAALFLASLAIHFFSEHQGLQKRWYQARALAESVKTAAWRFVMGAEPFDSHAASLDRFRALLLELLSQNTGIAEHLRGDWAAQDAITPVMLALHSAPFEEKRQCYLKARIQNEREWYACRAQTNQRQSRRFFVWLCSVYAVAILLLMLRIAWPGLEYLPIEALAVVASSIIGWKQLRRFNELTTAYNLTAHEVGIIQTRFAQVADAAELSGFVSDAENAFSREHTQWAARRDHAR